MPPRRYRPSTTTPVWWQREIEMGHQIFEFVNLLCSVVVKVVLGADEVRCATCKKIGETGEAVAGAAESIKDAAVHAAKSVVDPGKEAVVGTMMFCFH